MMITTNMYIGKQMAAFSLAVDRTWQKAVTPGRHSFSWERANKLPNRETHIQYGQHV